MDLAASLFSSWTFEDTVKAIIAAVLIGSLKWIGLRLRDVLRGKAEMAIALLGVLVGLVIAMPRGISNAPATGSDVFLIVIGVYIVHMHTATFGEAVKRYYARKRIADQPGRGPER